MRRAPSPGKFEALDFVMSRVTYFLSGIFEWQLF